jgi:hypothetical protein
MEKKCNICEISKPTEEFNKSSQHKSGVRNYCRECQKNISKKYSEKLGEELKIKKKKWKDENFDKVIESRKKTYLKHGKRISKEKYERIKSNPKEYLKILMRRRIRGIFESKNSTKKLPTETIVGCTFSELVSHLESMFKDGMCWENQGKWHIDHIIPLSSAKNEQEIYNLCHYKNLQPLWAKDNLKKGKKITPTVGEGSKFNYCLE